MCELKVYDEALINKVCERLTEVELAINVLYERDGMDIPFEETIVRKQVVQALRRIVSHLGGESSNDSPQ